MKRMIPFFILILLTLAAFGNSLNCFFAGDDFLQLRYLWQVFDRDCNLFNPANMQGVELIKVLIADDGLTELSLAIDYLLYSTHSFGYHLSSLIWHCVNACLLMLLVQSLTQMPVFYLAGRRERSVLAFLTAAIWAVWPVHTLAVCWISARGALLGTFFSLSAMLAWTHYLSATGSDKSKYYFVTALLVVPGLLVDPATVWISAVLYILSLFAHKGRRLNFLGAAKQAFVETGLFFIPTIICMMWRSGMPNFIFSDASIALLRPFHEGLKGTDSWPLIYRLMWGSCGMMTLMSLKVIGPLPAKFRLTLFAIAWLTCVEGVNGQPLRHITAQGDIYGSLMAAPAVFIILLSVYPIGAGGLSSRKVLLLKLAGYTILGSFIVSGIAVSNINTKAWIESAKIIKTVRGQLNTIVDITPDNDRIVLTDVPMERNGAVVIGRPGTESYYLKRPMTTSDSSQLDNANFAKQKLHFYYYDSDDAKLKKVQCPP